MSVPYGQRSFLDALEHKPQRGSSVGRDFFKRSRVGATLRTDVGSNPEHKVVEKKLLTKIIQAMPSVSKRGKNILEHRPQLHIVFTKTHKVKVRYSLTSVAQTTMMTSANPAHF